MSFDLLERPEEPEYTGENRCAPCTALNLLVVAGLAALVGRRDRALGILTFLFGTALVYLRGYLVPGTPALTERYLPASVLAAFGKADTPERLDSALTDHAADRATEGVPVEVTEPDQTAAETTPESEADATAATREDVEELLERPMDEVLEALTVVEEGDGDLVLVDSFRKEWEDHIETLADDEAERRATFAAILEETPAEVGIERREDGRCYGLLDGKAVQNWITEAALLSDFAAHRALDDPRWDLLEPAERLSVLRGFRVFLTTCPECGGSVSATDDVVESCCGSWEVIAIECGDCETRVLELEAPDSSADDGADPADSKTGGFTR